MKINDQMQDDFFLGELCDSTACRLSPSPSSHSSQEEQ